MFENIIWKVTRDILTFDFKKYMSALNYTKEMVFDPDDTSYSAFLVNRCFINYPDTVLHVVDIAMHSQYVPDSSNFIYWIGAIPKRKRYSKFPKQDKIEGVDAVSWAYNISKEKAIEYISYMDQKDVKRIIKDYTQNR